MDPRHPITPGVIVTNRSRVLQSSSTTETDHIPDLIPEIISRRGPIPVSPLLYRARNVASYFPAHSSSSVTVDCHNMTPVPHNVTVSSHSITCAPHGEVVVPPGNIVQMSPLTSIVQTSHVDKLQDISDQVSTWLGPGWETWNCKEKLLAIQTGCGGGLGLSISRMDGGGRVTLVKERILREELGEEVLEGSQVENRLQQLSSSNMLCRGKVEEAVLPLLASFPSPKLLTALFLIEKRAQEFVYKSRQCVSVVSGSTGETVCSACKQFFDNLIFVENTRKVSYKEEMEEDLHTDDATAASDGAEDTPALEVKVKTEEGKQRKRRPPGEAYQCHLCESSFISRASFLRHVRRTHGVMMEAGIMVKDTGGAGGGDTKREKAWLCQDEGCDKRFTSKARMFRHLRLAHSLELPDLNSNETAVTEVKCPYCPDVFKVHSGKRGSHRMRRHLVSVHQKLADLPEYKEILEEEQLQSVICADCGKSYSNQATLDSHVKLMHSETAEMEACHICGKSFKKGGSTLWGHIRTHEDGGHQCSICGAKFKVKSYLQRHVKSHDPESKRYECDICGDKFTRPYLMKQHQEFTHKKNLPFKCTECGKSLRSKTFLKIHMRSVHSKEKPFPCDVCGFRSSRVDNLNIHRTKVHHITTKVTRQSLKQLVLEGKHPFCSQPDDIPGF